MFSFNFKHVRIESMAVNLPPQEVTSAELEDRLAPLYERLKIPFGTLEKLSGVKSRYFWDTTTAPSEVATVAAREAVDKIGFDKKELKALFNCSVTRDYFEPATACLVHRNLGLPDTSITMDVTNACIGFSDGMIMLANLIEAGIVKAGVVVSGESISRVIQCHIDHMLSDETLQREDLLKLLPSLTLGSGAVSYVLCHDSIATSTHRFLGGVSRSATQLSDLCNGNGDYCILQGSDFNPLMHTESNKLISSAATLGGQMWKDMSEVFGWTREEVDHVFCHQVGKQVNQAFYNEMGLDFEKEYTIYKKYGNLISAALPTALAMGVEEKGVKENEKIVWTAFGSGLNSRFFAIEW